MDTVLEGSVRKSGNRLRITAQLINVIDGYHLWSDRFDRELADVFDIQDEISLAITDKLKLELLGDEQQKLTKRYTDDADSYNIYLKGLYFRRKLRAGDIDKSIELFSLAIDRDVNNALAWAGLAYAHMVSCFYSGASPKDVIPLAQKAVTKALEIDDQLAEAWEARAAISAYLEWDWDNAIKYIKKTIELKPGYAWGYFHLAHHVLYKGKSEESIRILHKALELDPLNITFSRNLGCINIFIGDVDNAIETLERTLEMDRDFAATHFWLGYAYMKNARYEEAIKEMQKETTYRHAYVYSTIGVVYSLMGNKDKARQILDELTEQPHKEGQLHKEQVSFYGIARLYFSLEEDDLGFEWLNKAYEAHDLDMYYMKVDFLMDRVRRDPRFISFLKKINLD